MNKASTLEIKKRTKKPSWLKVKLPTGEEFKKVRNLVSEHKLHTICESGSCPNMGECWGAGTATFMILGNVCTRSCGFCAVSTGKPDAPDEFDVGEGYYNKYMAGNVIAMPQPLYGDDVVYQDGTIATLEQEVLDVVTFLTWASMPELEKRKSSGIKVVIFLSVSINK